MQVKRLRGMSGFGWDDGRKLVVADDEHWNQLKKVCFTTNSLHIILSILIAEGPKHWEMENYTVPYL